MLTWIQRFVFTLIINIIRTIILHLRICCYETITFLLENSQGNIEIRGKLN